MGSLFPIRDSVSVDEDREPRLVDLDEETADEVFEALAAGTTREIFLALHEQPQAASDLAEATGTSVQNVQYHLEKLTDAELVEVVDTWYSERGSEMKVYAPTDESLVLYAGRDKQSSLRAALRRLVGAFGALVPASLAVGWLATQADTDGGDFAEQSAEFTAQTDGGEAAEDAPDSGDGGDDTGTASSDDGGVGTTDADTTEETSSQITDLDALREQVGETNFVSEDVLVEAGDRSVNATADIELSADGTVLALDQGDIAALVEASGTDPSIGLISGLAFFFGGLFVLTATAAWSVWR
ncbi:ArsR family transcriptional regulator [Halobacteriales archaeon QH_10_67_13]|nr:MAG: ArsR family transcriptional regulator [Halobacteriales archaeon QH_10_67_13]